MTWFRDLPEQRQLLVHSIRDDPCAAFEDVGRTVTVLDRMGGCDYTITEIVSVVPNAYIDEHNDPRMRGYRVTALARPDDQLADQLEDLERFRIETERRLRKLEEAGGGGDE